MWVQSIHFRTIEILATKYSFYFIPDPEDDHREKLPDIKQIIKKNIRKTCTKETILNRFPIIKWLPRYQLNYLYNDTIAGISVALTAIPQGIAYAVVAGLDPQYGSY